MRFFSVILLITILFLSVKPGIDQILSATDAVHSCCGGAPLDITADEEAKDDDCNDHNCNPFFDCNSCLIAFITVENRYDFKPVENYKNNIILPTSSVSNFSSEFWQPPKAV